MNTATLPLPNKLKSKPADIVRDGERAIIAHILMENKTAAEWCAWHRSMQGAVLSATEQQAIETIWDMFQKLLAGEITPCDSIWNRACQYLNGKPQMQSQLGTKYQRERALKRLQSDS